MTTETLERPPDRSGAALRQRRRRRTVAHVEHVALELFARNGFAATTIDQIAEAADISRRSFFRYFASKEDVLLGDRRRFEDTLAEALEHPATDAPVIESLCACLIELSREVEADAEATRLRLQLFTQSPETLAAAAEQQRAYQSRLAPLMARRMGLDTDHDLRPALVVSALMSATYIALWHWLAGGATQPLHEVVAEALRYTVTGFAQI